MSLNALFGGYVKGTWFEAGTSDALHCIQDSCRQFSVARNSDDFCLLRLMWEPAVYPEKRRALRRTRRVPFNCVCSVTPQAALLAAERAVLTAPSVFAAILSVMSSPALEASSAVSPPTFWVSVA